MQTGAETSPEHALIASDRVEGTPVKRSTGVEIGHIERLMIEKRSGKVAYAVMSVGGGIFGLNRRRFTMPWGVLNYNGDLGGYEVNLTDDQIRDAPQNTAEQHDASFAREWEEHIHRYYNATPYWGQSDPMSKGR